MPVVSVGQKLPSIYLDRFQPVEGLVYRISVLDTNAIATESHFLDIPSRDIKGSYQCIQGACCAAFGRRNQTYNVPIYVYRGSQPTSTDGEVLVWKMTASQWKKFSDMATTVDFKVYDIVLTAQKRGYGMDLTYSGVPDVKLRDWWTPEQKEQIPQTVASFYQLGEASLVNPMSFNDWNQLLYDCGYDLQNMQWPGGQSPMSQGNARRSMHFGVAVLQPSPGVLPPVPGMAAPPRVSGMPQGVVGAGGIPIMQPPPPSAGPVPPVFPSQSAPVGQFPVPQASKALSPYTPVGGAAPAAPLGPAPVVPYTPVGEGALGVPLGATGVPLGTPPVIPQKTGVSFGAELNSAVGASQSFSDTNTIPGKQEITMEEMEQLLS
jgi:hypothetical protein